MYAEIKLSYGKAGQDGLYKIVFTADRDEPGMLNRVSVVLFARGWDVISARSESVGNGVKDTFFIEHPLGEQLDDELCEQMQKEVTLLIHKNITCVDYLSNMFSDLNIFSQSTFLVKSFEPVSDTIYNIEIEVDDNPGVLMKITYQLDAVGIDIVAFKAERVGNRALDYFKVRWKGRQPFEKRDIEFLQELLNGEILVS